VVWPYRRWEHQHRFRAERGGTTVEDLVVYELPLGPLGALLHWLTVRRQLEAIFDYRRARIPGLLAPAAWAPGLNPLPGLSRLAAFSHPRRATIG